MVRVLIFLLCIAFVALGLAWLTDRPGDVALTLQGYRYETSLAVATLGLFAVALALAFIWTLIRAVFRFPVFFSMALQERREKRGFKALSKGLIAIGAGDMSTAQTASREAERLLGATPLALLLKAQTAQITGDRQEAERVFSQMVQEPATRVLGLRGLFVEARRNGTLVHALHHAREAVQLAPGAGWANEAVLMQACQDRQWREARGLLERRAKLGLVNREEAQRGRAVLLLAEASDISDTDPAQALEWALQAHKLLPALVPAATLGAKLLLEQQNWRKAVRVLEATWRLHPHPDLAGLYLDARVGDSAQDKLERARRLVSLAPDTPYARHEAQFTLAQAALKAKDMDVFVATRDTLLNEDVPTARVYLLAAEGEHFHTGHHGRIREWLARAAYAPRDACWMADGDVFSVWQPYSPVSGHLDALEWRCPPNVLNASGLLNLDVAETVSAADALEASPGATVSLPLMTLSPDPEKLSLPSRVDITSRTAKIDLQDEPAPTEPKYAIEPWVDEERLQEPLRRHWWQRLFSS